jgi:hypothetical protein
VVVGIAFAADPERAAVERDAATLMRVAMPLRLIVEAKSRIVWPRPIGFTTQDGRSTPPLDQRQGFFVSLVMLRTDARTPESTIAAGEVGTQANAILRTVYHSPHLFLTGSAAVPVEAAGDSRSPGRRLRCRKWNGVRRRNLIRAYAAGAAADHRVDARLGPRDRRRDASFRENADDHAGRQLLACQATSQSGYGAPPRSLRNETR